MARPPIGSKEDIERIEKEAHRTSLRRQAHLQNVGGDEIVHQLQDVIQHLDHSKTIRLHVGAEHADFMIDRARQILLELLGIHLEGP